MFRPKSIVIVAIITLVGLSLLVVHRTTTFEGLRDAVSEKFGEGSGTNTAIEYEPYADFSPTFTFERKPPILIPAPTLDPDAPRKLLEPPKADKPYMDELPMHLVKPDFMEPFDLKKVFVYMYQGCTSSHMQNLFWLPTISNQICDASGGDDCFWKSSKDYKYNQLGRKSGEWLKELCRMNIPQSIIVKVDDDTLMTKEEFMGILAEFEKADVDYTGFMSSHKAHFYWSGGPFFAVKSKVFYEACKNNYENIDSYYGNEDVQFGHFLNITDPKRAVRLDSFIIHHRRYVDPRVDVRFNAIRNCTR